MLEHKLCYGIEGEVPDEDYIVPFGKAAIRREGTDVTIIGWSRQVLNALEAAEQLEKRAGRRENSGIAARRKNSRRKLRKVRLLSALGGQGNFRSSPRRLVRTSGLPPLHRRKSFM